MVKKEIYKDYELYFFQDFYKELLENILEKKVKVMDVLKENRRSYIAVIEWNKKKYIIKESRNEYKLIQRKILSLFKKGEFVVTLENINRLIHKECMKEYAEPYGAIIKRKNGMICYNLMLMEYVGEEIFPDTLENMLEIIKKIHKKGYYHGDFNPSNFILKSNGELKIVDTQGKKMGFGNYRAHYDILTMKMDSFPELEYPYKKNIYYYLALLMKKYKKNPLVSEVKRLKNKYRDKKG
ncbi:lipopolysaccharide core heptose(II) kinase RfaY [Cetobacterium somerae]|uniref:lipopolysaccharide core heptose(II) kinase RfaY n=1 Tax=Cetobacterium somerae TaxID=188913 RepID=UPI00389276AD